MLGVFLRHHTTFRLAEVTGITPAGVFYILGGAWEVVLCGVILYFVWYQRPSIGSLLARVACVIGMLEGTMVAACRLALNGQPPKGTTQCDWVTGIPVTFLTMWSEIIVVAVLIGIGIWLRRK